MAKSIVVDFDSRVFRLEAVKKAAYRFGDRLSIGIELIEPSLIRAALESHGAGDDSIDRLASEFRNEVLDQELREVVAKETEAVRNLILVQAFSKTALLDNAADSADFRSDPLGIRAPDKE